MNIRIGRFSELDAATVYRFLRLRSEVFVVEQNCVYLDADGRDTEPHTLHMWIDDGGGATVASYLRVLRGPPDKIGRVCTTPSQRNRGYASALIARALTLIDGDVVLDAQAHLCDWYARFGFEVSGDEFIEDGIPHRPMTLRR